MSRFTNIVRRNLRLAGAISASLATLIAGILVISGCDAGAPTSDSRKSVEVAVAPTATVVAAEAAVGAAATTGTLTGVVTFDGPVPEPDVLVKKGDPAAKDAAVCAAANVLSEELVVNKDNKGIANVFIYLQKAPEGVKPPPPPEDPIVLDQQGCQFIPHALTVRLGQKIMVKSNDPIAHNTNTEAASTPFNQIISANDRVGIELKYKKAERLPQRVRCDVHTWMKSYHLIQDHPWMAVTDADGKFTIKDVPAGKHEFTIWHEKKGYLKRKHEVEIKPGATNELNLKYDAKSFEP